MTKGESYGYNHIENFANYNNFEINELGRPVVGEHFLILKHQDKDIVVSFVLSGAANYQYVYDCVYSDL